MTQTLLKAAQDMLDAVKDLSTAQGIDWTNPVYAPVALAHANLTDALTEQPGNPPSSSNDYVKQDGPEGVGGGVEGQGAGEERQGPGH